jgi:hypothetical protein
VQAKKLFLMSLVLFSANAYSAQEAEPDKQNPTACEQQTAQEQPWAYLTPGLLPTLKFHMEETPLDSQRPIDHSILTAQEARVYQELMSMVRFGYEAAVSRLKQNK